MRRDVCHENGPRVNNYYSVPAQFRRIKIILPIWSSIGKICGLNESIHFPQGRKFQSPLRAISNRFFFCNQNCQLDDELWDFAQGWSMFRTRYESVGQTLWWELFKNSKTMHWKVIFPNIHYSVPITKRKCQLREYIFFWFLMKKCHGVSVNFS